MLERFHIEKFRETQQVAIVNLLEGKDVLVSQPTTSEKFVIFSPSRSYAFSIRCCVDESDLLIVLWLPLCLTRLSSAEPVSLLSYVYKQLLLEMSKMTKALHAKKELRQVYFMSC